MGDSCQKWNDFSEFFLKFKGAQEHPILENCDSIFIKLAPVVQKLDNAIHRINHYPVDKC